MVVLDTGGKVSQVYAAPCSEILPDDFLFKPVKIAADDEGMLYVVSEGTYEGILTLDETGAFNGFIGANPVKPTPWEIFWKSIATRAQKDAMLQFIPVDHSSLDISADNFISVSYTHLDVYKRQHLISFLYNLLQIRFCPFLPLVCHKQ